MSFIRAKEIPPKSGNWYDYEVETIHEGDKVKQKVLQYLGKSGTYHKPLIGSGSHGSSVVNNSNNPANNAQSKKPSEAKRLE